MTVAHDTATDNSATAAEAQALDTAQGSPAGDAGNAFSGATDAERIDFAFRLATARHPEAAEIAVLERIFAAQREAFAKDEAAALKLLRVGESPRDESLAVPDLAAGS